MIKHISKDHLISQTEGNIVSDMDGEKVMLSIENGKYYNLGEVDGDIWERIKDPISFHNLIANMMKQFDVNQEDCEEQVSSFLQQLLQDGLIQVESLQG